MRDRFRISVTGPAIAVALGLIVYAANYAVVMALVAGVCVFILGWCLPRIMPWALAGVVALGLVFAPLVLGLLPNPFEKGPHLRWLNPSSAQRIIIWNNAVVHIKEKPVLGAGFDATRALYGKKDRVVYKFPDEIAGQPWGPTMYESIPLHPHNAVLQVWLELGAVGAAIILVPDGEDQPDIEETGGPKGPEPTRYGDWENKGRAIDF